MKKVFLVTNEGYQVTWLICIIRLMFLTIIIFRGHFGKVSEIVSLHLQVKDLVFMSSFIRNQIFTQQFLQKRDKIEIRLK